MNPKKIVLPILLLAAAGVGVWYYMNRPAEAETDLAASGTVEATDAQLGFQVPGRLLEVAVREGERVRAGQVLARLDPSESDARRAQAAAQVEAARAQLAELERGARSEEVVQARAGLDGAQDRLANAESDYQRTKTLFDGGAVSRETLDNARLALELARSQRTQAAEQLQLVRKGPRQERIEQARAQVAQAQAALQGAEVAQRALPC
jgi:HlyD family secretion protein